MKKPDIALLEKQNRVVELRHAHGMTLAQIAEELGYASPSGVLQAYKKGIERLEHPNADAYFKSHIDRLDSLIDVFYNKATSGDARAADMVLRLMAQQADLLGLKAPVRITQEVTNTNGPKHLEAEVRELARIIDWIEGTTADITTLPDEPDEGEQIEVAPTSA